ncbi:MAG: Gfo/Idh/MocA family oxidoreductase [Lentimonas sp.]
MKVAIVGFGFMGEMHAQVYLSLPGVELAAVVDIDSAGANKRLAALGLNIPVYATLNALLEFSEVQAIDICSPTGQHTQLAVEAAEAGKHLFIEKPLAFDSEGCQRIENAIQKTDVIAQVGHCIRFWPEYMSLKSTIESGELGALKSLSLHRRSARPVGGYPRHWANDVKLSGGAAFDMHVHDTDFVLHLFGLPKSVFSSTSEGMPGPDHIFTHYEYEHVAVHAEGGWDYPQHYGFYMGYEAVFEDGTLAYHSNAEATLTLTNKNQETTPVTVGQAGPKESATNSGNISALGGYFNELEYFTDCIKANKAPEIATIAQASESIRVLCAELESAKFGIATTL